MLYAEWHDEQDAERPEPQKITKDELAHALDYFFCEHLDALVLSAEIFQYAKNHQSLPHEVRKMSERTDPRESTTPLLPAWASDAAVAHEANLLAREIEQHYGLLRYAETRPARQAKALEEKAEREAPALIKETEAFLRHESEGWLSVTQGH